jgi:hypothetical protein
MKKRRLHCLIDEEVLTELAMFKARAGNKRTSYYVEEALKAYLKVQKPRTAK